MENTSDECSIFSLPQELLLIIFNKLSLNTIRRTETTSKRWQQISWGSIQFFKAQIDNRALANALKKMNPLYLRSISAGTAYTLDEFAPDLCILEKFTKLQRIKLQNNCPDNIEVVIRSIPYIPSLYLVLVNDKQFEMISSSLTNLTRLDLGINTLVEMPGLTNLTRLNRLDLSFGKDITDKTAENIFNLTNLTYLGLFRCDNISGEAFQHVSKLQKLKVLDIGRSFAYKTRYLTALQRLPNLEALDFWFFNGLKDADFNLLGNIPHLTKLAIFMGINRVSLHGLNFLTNLSRLVDLKVDYEPGAHLLHGKPIGQLVNLTKLSVHMNAEDLQSLTTLKSLQEFEVVIDTAEKEFFMNLAKLTALTKLDLTAIISYLGYNELTTLHHLTYLNIAHCDLGHGLTDSQLIDQLATLTKLRVLGANFTNKHDLTTRLTYLKII